jgi:hypothetical protein
MEQPRDEFSGLKVMTAVVGRLRLAGLTLRGEAEVALARMLRSPVQAPPERLEMPSLESALPEEAGQCRVPA